MTRHSELQDILNYRKTRKKKTMNDPNPSVLPKNGEPLNKLQNAIKAYDDEVFLDWLDLKPLVDAARRVANPDYDAAFREWVTNPSLDAGTITERQFVESIVNAALGITTKDNE